MKSRKRVLILLPVMAVLAVLSHRFYEQYQATDPNLIRVSGNIEVTDAEVSFTLPERVAQRPVNEGERIEKGQIVAALDTADLEQEVALRQAEWRVASAALPSFSGPRTRGKVFPARVKRRPANIIS